MNVLQMYWLRYGGHAAFQTKDIVQVEASEGKSKLPAGPKLQSAEDSELFLTGTYSTFPPHHPTRAVYWIHTIRWPMYWIHTIRCGSSAWVSS